MIVREMVHARRQHSMYTEILKITFIYAFLFFSSKPCISDSTIYLWVAVRFQHKDNETIQMDTANKKLN